MKAKNVSIRLQSRPVLQGLTFNSDAKAVGLIGRNGAGKSTLLRALHGLIPVESGYLSAEGGTGYIFQSPDDQILFPTVKEELHFPDAAASERGERSLNRAKHLLEQHNGKHLVGLSTEELSIGQKALVCLVSVLKDEPDVLLLDESLGGLDAVTTTSMMAELMSRNQRLVFATHQLHLLTDFDEVIWLDQGSLRLQGPPQDVIPAYLSWSRDLALGISC